MAKKQVEVALTMYLIYDEEIERGYGGTTYFVRHTLSNADIDGMEVEVSGDTDANEWVELHLTEHIGVISEKRLTE